MFDMNLAGTRCVNCGAKMKLVKVLRFNSFRAPEAVDYDISIARQKFGKKEKKATHEIMCPCCGFRLPAKAARALYAQQKAQTQEQTKVDKTVQKEATKAKKKAEKSRVGTWIKWIIFLAVLGVCAYFAYTNSGELLNVYNQLKDSISGIKDFLGGLKK
jgi:DNA-directed RNA polymerase subunit RPC12/RpoP